MDLIKMLFPGEARLQLDRIWYWTWIDDEMTQTYGRHRLELRTALMRTGDKSPRGTLTIQVSSTKASRAHLYAHTNIYPHNSSLPSPEPGTGLPLSFNKSTPFLPLHFSQRSQNSCSMPLSI